LQNGRWQSRRREFVQSKIMNVAVLRRGFKQTCVATDDRCQNFQIRVHRSLSWFERALALDDTEEPEARLLYAWIAFNALYGVWDSEEGFAAGERASWKAFVETLLQIDRQQLLAQQIQVIQTDILWLLECKFLDPTFWRNPDETGGVRRRYHQAIRLYHEGCWVKILGFTLDRIYVLRSQIVHGAATRGSSLNRESLTRCRRVLEALMPVILQLVIEQRVDDQWPPLCYPPIRDDASKPRMPRPR
jgi:Apea-like HEPN